MCVFDCFRLFNVGFTSVTHISYIYLSLSRRQILNQDTPMYGTLRELVKIAPELRFCQQVVSELKWFLLGKCNDSFG